MCNCGKGRRAAIPGTGPQVGGGPRGLPASRAIVPTTVAPMPPPQVVLQPRSRGVVSVRRAVPVATVAPPPIESQVALQQSAPVIIPSPPSRTRGGVRPNVGHGVDTAIWGPSAWYILHTLAELASATETGDNRLANHWASFIQDVAVSIPCPTCARHFRIWMGWVPFEASVAATTVRARFAELHNMVNRTKKVPDWSGDLSTMYNGTADDVRGRIATMRGIIGSPMLDAVEDMLNML